MLNLNEFTHLYIKFHSALSQNMRYWYVSHCRALKANASLRKCADITEPSLFACTKYG